jgi:PAS domain S-box-containing protein
MLDMDAGLRGYLLTGRKELLQPYVEARSEAELNTRALVEMVRDNPAQSARANAIRERSLEWDAWAQEMIARREGGGDYASYERNAEGLRIMEALRAERERLVATEQELREERSKEAARLSRLLDWSTVLLVLVAGVVIVALTRRQFEALASSFKAALEAEESNSRSLAESRDKLKKDEEHLRMLSSLVESSYDAIIGKKTDGTIASWNSGAASLYGYKAEEVIGQSVQILIPRDHPDEENTIISRIMRGEIINQYETVRQRKDGSLVEVSLRISPIFDHSGNIVGASNISRDITERKKTERALLQTEKLASVGRMAATVAHEVNNPLAAAINAVYLAKSDRQLSEHAQNALKLAEQELARVAHITKQTLGFYREGGKPTAVRLAEVLDNVLDLYEPRIRNRSLNVMREYGNAIEVSVIEGEIRHVISNLLANSIDANCANGTILIRLAGPMVINGARPMVRLTIADRGEGISRENQARLFEPFFTTKKSVGTGLGLWVTKELVHKQQGRIKVRSRLGKGTVVTVWLPTERRIEASLARIS